MKVAAMTELVSFVLKFKQLWKVGLDAHLDIESRAGQAWVGLHLRLADELGPVNNIHQFSKSKTSPARDRRRERCAAQKEALQQENKFENSDVAEEATIDSADQSEAESECKIDKKRSCCSKY